jgi:hypothetical protein
MAGRSGLGGEVRRVPLWAVGAVAVALAAVSFSLSTVASTAAHPTLPSSVQLQSTSTSVGPPAQPSTTSSTTAPTVAGGASGAVGAPAGPTGVVAANRPVVTEVGGSTATTVPVVGPTTTTTTTVTSTTDDGPGDGGGRDNSPAR